MPSPADIMPPTAYPENISATRVLRIRLGEYSLISDTTLGITPPMPSPAMNRSTPNCQGVEAKPLMKVVRLNSVTHRRMVFLRPRRSDNMPKPMAPNIMPNSALLPSRPAT